MKKPAKCDHIWNPIVIDQDAHEFIVLQCSECNRLCWRNAVEIDHESNVDDNAD